jgi:pSer/pThr/pTyr-binding forkhead associated (FHA) protein
MWLAFGSQSRELRDGEIVVGSGADADWRIGTADLMPRHFAVTVYDLNASLRATSKDNVVVVNGKQLVGVPHLLNNGDVIAAGAGRFMFSEHEAYPSLEPAEAPPPAFLISDTGHRGRELISRSTILGRDASVAIVILDPAVSRFHAEVRREAGGFALHSMGSAGTLLNGRKMSGPIVLAEGDVIEIAGRRWRFTHSAPSAGPPPPRDPSNSRQWRARAAETGTIDVIDAATPAKSRRVMTIVVGAIILLVAIAGYLIVTRG